VWVREKEKLIDIGFRWLAFQDIGSLLLDGKRDIGMV
jgi:hypothetical protein